MSDYWNKQKRYWLTKIRKLKGTPSSVAIGIACGVAVSFTPFVGAHLFLAMMLAWVMRGNIVAAALGTAFGNPWTFPFIWVSVLYTGRKMRIPSLMAHTSTLIGVRRSEQPHPVAL